MPKRSPNAPEKSPRKGRRDAARRRARPAPERLEARDLKTISLNLGTLAVVGSNVRNVVEVRRDTRLTPSPYDDRIVATQFDDGGTVGQIRKFALYTHLYDTPDGQSVYRKEVTKITFDGRDGHDQFENFTDIRCVASGGSGNDRLEGGAADDELNGGGGEDAIYGGDGGDLIFGGTDDDNINGAKGDDTIHGGSGDDLLVGSEGADLVYGNSGHDTLHGGSGADVLVGGSGDDDVQGSSGDDDLYGGDGLDTLRGGSQNDLLVGGDSGDDLHGDGGDDTLLGEDGNDYLDGGSGNDGLDGGEHTDSLYGGLGEDTLDGGNGGDDLWGGFHDDTLRGGDGGDILHGQEGEDRLDGGLGNDFLDAGIHDDVLLGGDGQDTLLGGEGDDFLKGASSPNVSGDGFADALSGGTGADRFVPEWFQAPNGAWANRDAPTDFAPSQLDHITGTPGTPLTLRMDYLYDGEGDEPYGIVWVGRLSDPLASFALWTGVDPDALPTILGPQPFGDLADLVILHAYAEHDQSSPQAVFTAVQSAMLPSLLAGQAQGLGRAALVEKLIDDMAGALVLGAEDEGDDDDTFPPEELVITPAELAAARDGAGQLLNNYGHIEFRLERI